MIFSKATINLISYVGMIKSQSLIYKIDPEYDKIGKSVTLIVEKLRNLEKLWIALIWDQEPKSLCKYYYKNIK